MLYKHHWWLYLGSVLAFVGLLLRCVDSFVLRPGTTRFLNNTFGPSKETAQGMARNLALQSDTIAYHQVSPPVWLGWALLCCGLVMLTHGLIRWRSSN